MKEQPQRLYACDPELNVECQKTECHLNGGTCEHTFHKEFRLEKTRVEAKYEDTIFYPCFPPLHTECPKTNCHLNGGHCRLTVHKEFSVEGSVGISGRELLKQKKIPTTVKE